MSVRDAMIAAIQAIHGVDLEYDDGVDADALLAAVAPLIRRAALEEAAGVAENRHLGWVFPHPDDARPGEVCDDATACADIAAAIRALDT